MKKINKILYSIFVCSYLHAMREPIDKEIEKNGDEIAHEEKLTKDLEKVHKKVCEIWKKKSPAQRRDLTKSV